MPVDRSQIVKDMYEMFPNSIASLVEEHFTGQLPNQEFKILMQDQILDSYNEGDLIENDAIALMRTLEVFQKG